MKKNLFLLGSGTLFPFIKEYIWTRLISAFVSVLSGFLPYFFIGGMIKQLLAGENWNFYLLQWHGAVWPGLATGFHGISMLSHAAAQRF